MAGLIRKTIDIPQMGGMRIRELSGTELSAISRRFQGEAKAAEAAKKAGIERDSTSAEQIVLDLLDLVIETWPDDVPATERCARMLPMASLSVLMREALLLSRLNVPELEDLKPGEEYETHEEAAAEDF